MQYVILLCYFSELLKFWNCQDTRSKIRRSMYTSPRMMTLTSVIWRKWAPFHHLLPPSPKYQEVVWRCMFLTLPFGYYSKIDEKREREIISESGHFYGFNDKMMINYFRYKVLLRRKSPPGVLPRIPKRAKWVFDEASQEIRFGHALRGEFHKLSFGGKGYQTTNPHFQTLQLISWKLLKQL